MKLRRRCESEKNQRERDDENGQINRGSHMKGISTHGMVGWLAGWGS